MEKKRNGLDNYFRENLSDFELSEKKANWELLDHLLNEQQRKKKRRKWFLLFLSFFVIISSGLLMMLPDKTVNKTGKENTEPDLTSKSSSNDDIKVEKNNSDKIVRSDKIEIVNDGDDNQQMKIEKHIVNQEKEISFPDAGHNKKTKSSNTIHENSNVSTDINSIKNNASTLLPISKNENNNNTAELGKENDSLSKVESKDITALTIDDESNKKSTENETSKETSSQDLILNDSSENKDNGEFDVTQSELKNSIKPDLLQIRSEDSTKQSLNNVSQDSVQAIKQATRNLLGFNFYAGMNMYNTSHEFTNHKHLSPIVGIEFIHFIDSNFSIGLASLYSLQGGYHLSDTTTSIQETYFLDRSEDIHQQSILVNQLHQLYFPLTLYYKIAERHSVVCAFQLSYLINTSGIYTESNTISGIKSVMQENNKKGYMDGIKSTVFSVSIGYKYSLSKRFDLSARVSRELTESVEQEYFYGVNTNPSWSLQTFLIVKF
jgi:hypothetical protein